MRAGMTRVPVRRKTTSASNMVRATRERGTLKNDFRVQVLLTENTVMPLGEMETSRGGTGQRGNRTLTPDVQFKLVVQMSMVDQLCTWSLNRKREGLDQPV